jgi:predicted esterase
MNELKLQGNEHYKRNEYQKALECYKQALDLATQATDIPIIYTLRLNCAQANLKLLQFPEALDDADTALAIQSTSIRGLYRKASALIGLARNSEAATIIHQALTLYPTNQELNALLTKIHVPTHPSSTSTEEELLKHTLPPLFQEKISYVPCPIDTSSSQQSTKLNNNNRITPHNIIIAFHGLGDAPSFFRGLLQQLQLPNTSILILGGPYTVPGAPGGTYYKVFEDDYELIIGRTGEMRRIDSMKAPLNAVKYLIRRLRPHYDGIHLFGYRHGGTFATELAIQCTIDDIQLESCISISAGLLPEHHYEKKIGVDVDSTVTTTRSTPMILVTVEALEKGMVADLKSQKMKMEEIYGIDDVEICILDEATTGSGSVISGPNEAKILMTFWSRVLIQMNTEGLIDVTNPNIMITKDRRHYY